MKVEFELSETTITTLACVVVGVVFLIIVGRGCEQEHLQKMQRLSRPAVESAG